jgi:hypothetical protein
MYRYCSCKSGDPSNYNSVRLILELHGPKQTNSATRDSAYVASTKITKHGGDLAADQRLVNLAFDNSSSISLFFFQL